MLALNSQIPALVSNVAPRVAPMMMSANKYASDAEAPPAGVTSWYDSGLRLDGVVAPTAAPEPIVEAAAAARLEAAWNPKGLDVSAIPADVPGVSLFKEQFISENLNSAPAYLDGSMPGDRGFDPWGLIALAKPSLAMLATLGWVAAEKLNAKALYFTTNGKAPSLFNGHLLDYALPLVVVFGGFAALEFLKKEEGGLGGDFGFDPLGFSRGQGPIPFDALPFEVPNVGDMTALKEAEIKNGRAAMMAITGFAVQEFIWGTPVVAQTPLFF